MPFITSKCPKCNKIAEANNEYAIAGKIITALKCGHIIEKEVLNCSSPEQLISLDGKKLYPFQCEGVRFIENSGGRCLIADEMGLGKTVQAIGALFLHKEEMLPVLYIVKSALKTQWQKEHMRWMGEDYLAQILDSPKDFALPGLTAYIMSYDILRRFAGNNDKEKKNEEIYAYDFEYQETETSKKKGKLVELLEKLKIKTIVLDECQQIKNPGSQRSIFVRAMCKHVDNVIALSGTPIKNNAAEYFPILNILRPEMFPKYSTFLMHECDSYFNGYAYKTGGLRNPERFMEKTKSFIIRRERKEVLSDLPDIRRSYQFHELSKSVEKIYIETFKQFRDEYNSVGDDYSFESEGNILALMSRLRHIAGLSKIDPCVDYVMEIMGSTEDRVTIFVHHNDVAEILIEKLNSVFKELGIPPCARHKAGDSALETEKNFEKTRVLVCSTLAGGEGLNLQKLCSRFIMLERQWNPANEEQAEARFPRPEGLKVDFIDGVYLVAVGTIDELFAEIVERKREIFKSTMSGGEAPEWDQSSIMKELAEVLATTGGRRWQI